MSFIFSKREDSARYKVRVVGTDTQKVNSLTKPASKGKRVISNVISKTVSAVMVALFASLALLGTLVSATPAQADFIKDGFKAAFCSAGMHGYDLSTKSMGANTGDHKVTNTAITPYEKYGTGGLNYTVWIGPERPEGLKEAGEFGGIGIVNFAGGKDAKSGIDTWGESFPDVPDNESIKQLEGFYNKNQECIPVGNIAATEIANGLLNTTGEVITITNLVYQTAYESSSNIIIWLTPVVKSVVGTLKNAIFMAFLTPVIMISALWMAWVGLVKRQSTQMAQGAMWMIGASVTAVALMSNPMWLPNTINTGVSSISEAGMNSVASATSGASGDDICVGGTTGPNPTDVDASSGNKFITPTNEKTRQNVRRVQCTLWYSFLYTPWVMGQFGVSPNTATEDSAIKRQWVEANDGRLLGGQNKDVQQLGAAAAPYSDSGYRTSGKVTRVKLGSYVPDDKSQNWALFMLDNQINYDGNTDANRQQQRYALLNVTASQLHRDDYNATFKGNGAEARMATAGLALIAALGAGLMVIIVSMSIVILDVGMIILVLISPLFFLIGVHPGMGRRIALGWAETILGLAIKRVVLSMILSVMLVFYSAILAEGSKLPWMISMILVVAVSIGGITYKDKILDMFGKVSLGGNGGFGEPDVPHGVKRFAKNKAKKALGMGTGEFDAKELGKVLEKSNRGAGSRPAEGSSGGAGGGQTAREKAAAAVLAEQNSGAGEAPRDEAAGEFAGEAAGAAADLDGSGVSGAKEAMDDLTDQGAEETAGAGDRPQHYTDANGNIVDIDGNVVESSELSAEERAAIEGAGERPKIAEDASPSARAIENMRSSNPAVIAAQAEREANKNRLLPPLPVTPALQDEASRYNKAVDKEHAKLKKNSDTPDAVTRNDAMDSLKKKDEAAAQAREIREQRKQFIEQKRREILVEPARELQQMAASADAAFGNPVKKTVQKAASATQRAGAAIDNKFEQRIARDKFEQQVTERMKQDAKQMKAEARERRERQKSVPKEFRNLV